jgi:dephospho-CoA kinase
MPPRAKTRIARRNLEPRAVGPPVEKRTPFVGLTGAVAAGKSSALEALDRLGAATLSSDAIVHELLETERVRDLLVARWGSEVAPGGRLDRARVGAIVFEHPDELGWLEETLHPLVAERILAWRHGLDPDATLAVVEVPLLFEAGMEAAFDATICVVAPLELRAERAGARGTEAFDQRVGRQLSQEEKAARATYVVRNDGSLADLEAQLAQLLPDIAARGSAA